MSVPSAPLSEVSLALGSPYPRVMTAASDAPILVLSPRITEDSEAVARAASATGWEVDRLPSWRVPERLRDRKVALYGEVLFVEVVAARLGLTLLEAPAAWLTT